MTIERGHASSSAENFAALALAVEDFEVASKSLLSLKKLNQSLAREVALKILLEQIGDRFYHALAFEVLYSVALNDALNYMESNASKTSLYVLGAMIECVTEDAGALKGRDQILKAVSLLKDALNCRPPEDIRSLATKIDRFEQAFR